MKNAHFLFSIALGLIATFFVACSVGNGSLIALGTSSWMNSFADKTSLSDDFQEFISGFPKAKLPLQIDQQTINFFKPEASWKKRLISDKFSTFIPYLEDSFSRLPTQREGQYVAHIASNSQFVAVIYSLTITHENFFYKEEPNQEASPTPIRFLLATYTPSGRIIDERVIAYEDVAGFATSKIDKNLTIKMLSISHYNEEDNDYRTEKRQTVYKVNTDGTIETVSENKIENKDAENKSRTDYVF